MTTKTEKLLLQRRSIRAFKPVTLTPEQCQRLMEVARQAATSTFLQQCSVIHVTDEALRATIREVCRQKYVGANGDLFIFVVDLYRNYRLRQQQQVGVGQLHTTDVFMQGVEDTMLAVQSVATAAESMDLGCVFLGSIQNDIRPIIKALHLPQLTFPLIGLQVGIPDQQPQLKPRLPLALRTFDNHYQDVFDLNNFQDYDQVVHTYYDLRDANRRVDTFTNQIKKKLTTSQAQRNEILPVLHEQGLCWK